MFPRPRDFSSGIFKYKSTAAGEPPTDEDLLRTVRDGLPASAMPYFAGLLSTEELNAVVAAGEVVFKCVFPAWQLHRNPRCNSQLAGKCGPRKDAICRTKAAPHATATPVAAANVSMMDPATQVFARDLTAPWAFRGGSRAAGHLVAPDHRYHAGTYARLRGRAVCRRSLGPGELRRVARPHATMGKGR